MKAITETGVLPTGMSGHPRHSRLQRNLLGTSALAAPALALALTIATPDTALAQCQLTAGTGTAANPDTNAEVTCLAGTASTTPIGNATATGVAIVVEDGAALSTADINGSVYLGGTTVTLGSQSEVLGTFYGIQSTGDATVILGDGATVTGTVVIGIAAQNILDVTMGDGSTVSGNAAGIAGDFVTVVAGTGATITAGGGAGIQANNTSTINLATGAVVSGASLGILGGSDVDSIDNAGLISGGSFSMDLNGGNDSVTLRTGSSLVGTADGGLGTDSLVLLGSGSEDDNFVNFESLTMQGTDWTLSGTSSVGNALISSGTLGIDGALTGTVSVGSAGTLGGTGTVTGAVTNDGTVAAGYGTGTLTVDGSYTQTAGGTLQVEIDRSGQAGLLNVTGGATLAGTLQVSVQPGRDSIGTNTVLSAAGGLTGAFDNVVSNSRAMQVFVSTTANDVQVATVSPAQQRGRNDASISGGVLTLDGMTGRMADLRDASGGEVAAGSAPRYGLVGGMTGGSTQQIGGLNALMGGSGQSAVELSDAAVAQPNSWIHAYSHQASLVAQAPESDTQTDGEAGVWVRALGRFGSRDSDDGVAGSDHTVGALIAGLDTESSSGLRYGGSLAYLHGIVEVDDNAAETTEDGIFLGVYASTDLGDNWFLDATAMGGWSFADNEREVLVLGVLETATADFDVMSFGARLAAGTEFSFGEDYVLRPVAAVDYVIASQDGYTETGAGAGNMTVEDSSASALRLSGVVGISRGFETDLFGGPALVTPVLRAGVVQEFALGDRSVDAQLPGFNGGTSLALQGDDEDRTLGVVGVGFDAQLSNGMTTYFDYQGEFASGQEDHLVAVGLRMSF